MESTTSNLNLVHYVKTARDQPRIVLADDHDGFLRSVAQLLIPHYDVIAAVHDGRGALEAVVRLNPNVAVLDISMPELNGFQTALKVKERLRTNTRLIFLTVHSDVSYISEALEIGVRGYVLKSRIKQDLICAIEQVLAGYLFISIHQPRL